MSWFVHAADWFALRGEGYAFWSGIGSGSPIIAGVYLLWRRHNCHVKWCPRIQWRNHGDHLLCKQHHPSAQPSAEQFARKGVGPSA